MSHLSLPNAIVAYLRAQASGSDDKYSQAADLIASRAGLTDAQLNSPPAPGLESIWNVFLKTTSKAGGAPDSAETHEPTIPQASSSAPQTEGSSPSADDKSEAEKLKAEGNKAMSSKDYGAAIAAYTKAIKLDATSPVYFSNRAAAYSQAGAHDRAVEDAEAALRLDSNFSKAYSRKGHALFSLGDYSAAADAYQKGLDLEPTSKVMQAGLDSAKKQAAESGGSNDGTPTARDTGADAGAGAGSASNPLAGLGGMGGGGMPNLSDVMNNPQMQQMAQQMMQNGSLNQLMSNPMLRQMAERMGENGGTPDFSQIQEMMRDPQMMQLAQSMMGGLGGLGGMGGGR